MNPRLLLAALSLALLASACPAQETAAPSVRPTGAPSVSAQQVDEHAAQFDSEVPEREPGSDEEFAAASYLLGHLQLAGYGTFLDAVPVEDLIRSTNVIAFPPSGRDPQKLVVVEYGTAGAGPARGPQLGLFLELARSLQVAEPDHAIGFVALGAASPEEEVSLGMRRLTGFLEERELQPSIIEFHEVPDPEVTFKAYGTDAPELNEIALVRDPGCRPPDRCELTMEDLELPDTRYLETRDLPQTIVTGVPEEIGAVLLEWLAA